jgi:phage tail sheath protein FI
MDIVKYDENSTRLYDDSRTKVDIRKTSELFEARAIDNNYAGTYLPDVHIDDPINNRVVKVPASVAALGTLAYNDKVAFPWYAPAGFNRGGMDLVRNVETRLNSNDRDTLYDARINPIAVFPNTGYVIFGQKTLQQAKSALDRVNVRRLMLEIKRQVVSVANNLLFEPNNAATRARFVGSVTPLLSLIQLQAGIEQFRVVMDDSNNTPEDALQNKLNGRIIVVPTRAVEFISIDFVITNSGVAFA